jgi:hypothetical protein
MRTKKTRSFTRVLGSLLISWLILGSVAYSFYPKLTGHRILDAVLVSAMATVLLATLAEPVVGLLYPAVRHLSGRGDEGVQPETRDAEGADS